MTKSTVDPAGWVSSLIYGYRFTGLVGAVAQLKLADHLATRTLSAGEIAARVQVPIERLTLVLRALVAVGLLTITSDGRYQLTEFGAVLRSDHPQSLRTMAAHASRVSAPCYERLIDSLRGDSGLFVGPSDSDSQSGGSIAPGSTAPLDELLVFPGLAESIAARLTLPHRARSLVDVGGGTGVVLARLLGEHPGISGVLFDLPEVVARATALSRPGLEERWCPAAGSFFDSVPPGADVYALTRVLCNWPDDAAIVILENCRRAMVSDGTVYVVEQLLPDVPEVGNLVELGNLDLFVAHHGQLRTLAALEELLRLADLRLVEVLPLSVGDDHQWAILAAGLGAHLPEGDRLVAHK